MKGRAFVLMDSGIRRGTDIIKALVHGANADCVGRPCIWGLGSFGQAGVERALDLLQSGLNIAMAFVGTPTHESIESDAIGGHVGIVRRLA